MPRFLCAAVLLVTAAVLLAPRPARADDLDQEAAAREVKALLAKAPADDVPALWALSRTLRELDKAAIPALREALAAAAPGPRLAIARALVLLGDETKGFEVLMALVVDPGVGVGVKVAALKVVEREGDEEQGGAISKALDDALDPTLKMALAKALWNLNSAEKAKAKAVMLEFLKSEDRDRRAEGALALGEIGAAAEAKPILLELSGEPTERGRSAAFLLRLTNRDAVDDAKMRAPPGAAAGATSWPLLDEIRRLLLDDYVDPSLVDMKKIEDGAAEGLTQSLDLHTQYLSPEANARLLQLLDPTYSGVGAYVKLDPDNAQRFTVSRPIWGGPLHRAGLRAGDVIEAIDGEPTLGLPIDECVRRLKAGPAGTKVVVSVRRPGWAEKQDFALTRANITIPTVEHDLLPGDVGFVQVLAFSDGTAREVRETLDDFAAKGVKAVVVDLRGNGGGLLRAAVEIASEFLPAGDLVVSEKGRAGVYRSQSHPSTGPSAERPRWPVRVLVDGGTASAAEILAGSLRIHDRARLVGTQTYGKGSVQIPLPLASRPGEPFVDRERLDLVGWTDLNENGRLDPGEPLNTRRRKNGEYDPPEKFTDQNGNGVHDDGEPFVDANRNGLYDEGDPFTDANRNGRWDPGASIKITVAKYFLPDGRNLNGKVEVKDFKVVRTGGLLPDTETKAEVVDFWERGQQQDLWRSGAVRRYVEDQVAKDTALADRLARSDQRDAASYPGFDAFYEGLHGHLSKQAVRVLVRLRLRESVSDRIGRELVGDVVDDPELRTALTELFVEMGIDPKSVPDLAFLARPVTPPVAPPGVDAPK